MIRFLVRLAVFLVSAAVGLLVATWLVDGVSVTAGGFVIAVVLYALIQSIMAPFLTKVAMNNATAFLGGMGLVATFVALLVTSWVSDALTITGGATTWIAATVIVWLVTALATMLLPFILVKSGVEAARARR
ncbi:MAG TPA: phage holin family protein [Nocardioides sp.]|uniref:hypothetical protein n=1 Tax=Nocardioides sp. TaxID=35761 RepID=UPI002D05AC82|nr:hypothetical protein [Nocardioides sp.]HQR26306.1 phage holin family protein [Nocardioides sp.]